MSTALAATALLMGLAGGPHCVAMCGAACAGIGQAAGERRNGAIWAFQAGRVAGYSVLGAFSAASMQGLGWLATHTAALRPVWTLFHVGAIVLGLLLLWQARQPVWMEGAGKLIWARARTWVNMRRRSTPLLIGAAWALLPCGLLYSALLVAAMSAHALEGALVMGLFAAGTGVSMVVGPRLWLQLRGAPGDGWGVRLAGLALAASSSWAIWMGLVHDQAPWCLTS